jgi:hypothetical protein
VVPIFDGTNLPVIVSAGVAAPTGLADTERFTLGPVSVGGFAIGFVQSISIDFGNQVETVGGDGDVYPKSVDIQNFAPTITITSLDVSEFASAKLKLDGVKLDAGDASIVLRRRVNGAATFSEDADSIELTCAGVASVQSVSASGNQPKTMQILITCIHDGTNEPIVAATDHDLTPA